MDKSNITLSLSVASLLISGLLVVLVVPQVISPTSIFTPQTSPPISSDGQNEKQESQQTKETIGEQQSSSPAAELGGSATQEEPTAGGAAENSAQKKVQLNQKTANTKNGQEDVSITKESNESGQLSFTQLFEKTENGVVKISVEKMEQSLFFGQGQGSGFVYNRQGHIITNFHVVENAEEIIVTFPQGGQYTANVVGKDRYSDLAVIKVDSKDPSTSLEPLKLADSETLKVGDEIVAIGNPFGLSGSMSTGIVSQLGRLLQVPSGGGFSIPDVIQIDAAINPGNSGGPLLNMQGKVVGVTTAIKSLTGDFAGVGFAIPSNTVSKIVPELIENGSYDHPWLGISGVDVSPRLAETMNLEKATGFMIMSVVDNSPADKAGLHGSSKIRVIEGREVKVGGDIIVSIDGKKVRAIEDILIHLQREKEVGDIVQMGIIRDGNKMQVDLSLEKRPENIVRNQ